MGGKQRAWTVGGGRWLIDEEAHTAYLMVADGEAPVLCLPPALTAEDTELTFGWAISDLTQQRGGWLALVQQLARLAERAA